MSIRDILTGTGVALVTPFKSDESIDLDAYAKLVNFVIDEGVNYVVVLGTTGETPTLTRDEKIVLIQATYDVVGGRVPVVVGIGGNNTKSVVKDIEEFPLDQAVAILSASPYYNKPSQEGIYQHYAALASATTKPIVLYNVPGRTGSNIEPGTAIRLAKDFSNIVGIKEASGNMIQCMRLLRDKPLEFLVVSGDDHLALSQIATGMRGVISVAANCFPRDFSRMVECALADDYDEARRLNLFMLEGYDILFAENNPAGVKAVLAEMGLIENNLRLPVVSLSEALQPRLKAYMAQLSAKQR